MRASRNSGRLITYILICSTFAAGFYALTTRAARASRDRHARHPTPAAEKSPVPAEPVSEETRVRVREAYDNLPLSFEENRGQVDPEVRYFSRGAGYTLFLTPTEAVLSLRSADGEMPSKKERARSHHRPQAVSRKSRSAVLRMKLRGANRSPAVMAESEMQVQTNYFKGNDPKNWHTGVARFERVRYSQVYPGVDMIYYGQQQQLEYDFEVAPGAEASRIALEFEGVRRIKVERGTGELVLKTAGGEVRQRRPVAYQEERGQRREVASRYVMKGKREVGIEVGEYDRTKPLVIDPVLTYSTYLGGTQNDWVYDIAADSSGNAYVVGLTTSPDFPTFRQYQKSRGILYYDSDAFVAKINTKAAGRASLVYSTYLGGAAKCCAAGTGIAVDSAGIIYVVGETGSPDFPLLNHYQTYRGGGQYGVDAFLAKLDPNLSGAASLIYSTYLGGSDSDYATGVAIDSAGNAYVTGNTSSTDFPTLHRYKAKRGGQDAFVTRLDTNASGAAQLVYSTYLGGSRDDFSRGIAADSAGNAYVAGYTHSPDFPTFHAYQTAAVEPYDVYQHAAFVTRLDTNQAGAASLRYSTYLNSPLGFLTQGTSSAYSIAADSSGNVYVTGETDLQSFPTLNQYPTDCYSIAVAFVTRLDTNQAGAASLTYSTFLCGRGIASVGLGIALDPSGNVYVTGWTYTTEFLELNPSQKYMGENNANAFVVKLNPNLSGRASLLYSTLLGGREDFDQGNAIAVDSSGNAYVTGETWSTDFPRVNQYPSYHPALKGFVTKLTDSYTVRGRITTSDGTTGIGAVSVTLSGSKNDTFVTNSNGEYFFAQLITGGDYTITPSKGDLTFTPSRRTFKDLEADQPDVSFRTRAATVSGRVTIGTAAGEGLGGVTMMLTGGTGFATRTVTTSVAGTYSFGNLPTPRSYKVTPSKPGYNFDPAQLALINLTGNQSGANFTASPKTNTVSTGAGP